MKKITILQLIAIALCSFFVNVMEAKAQSQQQGQIKYNRLTDNRLEFWVTNLPKVHFECSDYFNDNNYNFLWYFGDGQYSQADKPIHEYHDTGTFTVRVESIPIYGTTEPEIIILEENVEISGIQAKVPRRKMKHGKLEIRNSCQLVPNTNISFVISHNYLKEKKMQVDPQSTTKPVKLIRHTDNVKIVFQYPCNQFDFKQGISPDYALRQLNNDCLIIWKANTDIDSTKNLLVALDVKDEIAVPHNSTIPFIYKSILNNDFTNPIREDTLYLQVGKSLDPNKKEVNLSHITRGVHTLKYQVHFQNLGDAFAYKVRIEDQIDEWLDINTLTLTKVVVGSPPQSFAPFTPDKDIDNRVVTFHINDIALPGTGSRGYNRCAAQSTMGYIEYEIKTIDFSQPYYSNGDLIPDGSAFGSYADIYFDDNGAIRTNDVYTQLDVNNSFCPILKDVSTENWNDTLVLTSVQETITTENLVADRTTSTVFDAGKNITLKSGTLIQGDSWLVIDGCGAGNNPTFKQGNNNIQNTDLQEDISLFNTKKQQLKIYPNPFKNSATIEYELNEKSPVSLQIFNINGQLRETLQNGEWMEAGKHKVYFDASDLPNGIYLCKLQTKKEQFSLKLQIFK